MRATEFFRAVDSLEAILPTSSSDNSYQSELKVIIKNKTNSPNDSSKNKDDVKMLLVDQDFKLAFLVYKALIKHIDRRGFLTFKIQEGFDKES